MSERIYIFDTTLRDGEQVPGCQLHTKEKVIIARELEQLGVDVIEAGFPISSPGDYKSVIEISKAVKDTVICALTRAVEKDIEVAAESLRYANKKRIHTGIGSSDYHIKYKFNSTRDRVLERAIASVKFARKFVDEVEFYAEDAGRADNAFLAKMVEAVIAAGAKVVNIPDTTGYCLPWQYGEKIQFLMDHVANIDQAILSCHCHNDLGMATANSISGIQNGARQVEVTINGIGERAGNTSLEEVSMILQTHEMGFHTEINSKKLNHLSQLVSGMMNMPVQPNKAIVGANAFAHSSGIHQDGVIKNRENYEIIAPEDVGVHQSSIILTARSGRAALNHHLERLGFQLDKDDIEEAYQKFLLLADSNKEISDDDLIHMMEGSLTDNHITIGEVQVISGSKPIKPVATIQLFVDGELFTASASGNGSINASLNAVNTIMDEHLVLNKFDVESLVHGSRESGKVSLRVLYKDKLYFGYGEDDDIVMASVQAYVDAINKMRFKKTGVKTNQKNKIHSTQI